MIVYWIFVFSIDFFVCILGTFIHVYIYIYSFLHTYINEFIYTHPWEIMKGCSCFVFNSWNPELYFWASFKGPSIAEQRSWFKWCLRRLVKYCQTQRNPCVSLKYLKHKHEVCQQAERLVISWDIIFLEALVEVHVTALHVLTLVGMFEEVEQSKEAQKYRYSVYILSLEDYRDPFHP